MTIADRIKNRRKELGMTQMDLAMKMGLRGKSSIADIEAKGDKVTLKNIEKIAKALNCSETYLMGFEEEAATGLSDKNASDASASSSGTVPINEDLAAIIKMCESRSDEQLEYIRKLIEVATSTMN